MSVNRRRGDNIKNSVSPFQTDLSSSNFELNEAFDAGSNWTSGTDNFVSCEESPAPSDHSSHILAGRFVNGAKQGESTQIVQSFTDSTILAGQLEISKKDDTFDEVTTILKQLVSLPFNDDENIGSNNDENNDENNDDSMSVCQMCKNKFHAKIQTVSRDANYNVRQALNDQCIKHGQTSKRVPLTIKNLKEHTDISASQYLKHRSVPAKHYFLSPRNKPSSSKVLMKNIRANNTTLNIIKHQNYVDRLTTLLEESHNERQHEELHRNTKFIHDESTPQWAPSFTEWSVMDNQSKSRACAHNPTKSTNIKVSSTNTNKTLKDKEKHINVKDSPIPSRLMSTTSRRDDSFLYLEHLCKVCDNSVLMENTSTEAKHNSSSSSSTALDLICDVQMASLDNEKSLDLNAKLLRELIATKKLCRDLIDIHPDGISNPRLRRTRQSLDTFIKVLTQEERMASPNKKEIQRSIQLSGNNMSKVISTSPIKPVSSLRKLFSPKLSTFTPSTTSSSSSVRRSVKSPIKNVRLHLKPSSKRVVQRSPKKLPVSKSRAPTKIPTTPKKRLPTLMLTESTPVKDNDNCATCAGMSSASRIFVTPSKTPSSNKVSKKLKPRKYFPDVL